MSFLQMILVVISTVAVTLFFAPKPQKYNAFFVSYLENGITQAYVVVRPSELQSGVKQVFEMAGTSFEINPVEEPVR